MNATLTLPAGIFANSQRSPDRWERSLLRREMFTLDATRDLALACVEGVLWITVDGDAGDHVLSSGQSLRLGRGSRAYIQAVRTARFAVRRA